jgi:hypothetical protein
MMLLEKEKKAFEFVSFWPFLTVEVERNTSDRNGGRGSHVLPR